MASLSFPLPSEPKLIGTRGRGGGGMLRMHTSVHVRDSHKRSHVHLTRALEACTKTVLGRSTYVQSRPTDFFCCGLLPHFGITFVDALHALPLIRFVSYGESHFDVCPLQIVSPKAGKKKPRGLNLRLKPRFKPSFKPPPFW